MQKFKDYMTLTVLVACAGLALRGWYEFMKEYGQWLTSLGKKKN